MLKGGHEAPTKPKGRPKKNSIPTTEEIEAEELRMKIEEQERMRRVSEDAALIQGAGASPLEPEDLSSEGHSPSGATDGPEREQPLLMSETHSAS